MKKRLTFLVAFINAGRVGMEQYGCLAGDTCSEETFCNHYQTNEDTAWSNCTAKAGCDGVLTIHYDQDQGKI